MKRKTSISFLTRAVMTLLVLLMPAATTRAQLVSNIDCCEGAPGGYVFIAGWVYDQGLKHWQAGEEIQISAFLSRSPNDQGWDQRSDDVEYVVRDDVNSTFNLSGKHGFRICIEVYPDLFEELTEMPLYVKIYATVNNGNGYEDILLNSPETPVTVTAQTTIPTTTSTYNYDKKTWTLYTGFIATNATGYENSYGNIVDGNLKTTCNGVSSHSIIEFYSGVPIMPKGFVYNCYSDNSVYRSPQRVILKAKAFPTDEWTELFRTYTQSDLLGGAEIPLYCNNAGDAKYQYFQVDFEVPDRKVKIEEVRLFSYYYIYFPAQAATCTETGISQDCYLRNDGRYFDEEWGGTELNAADVVLPIIPHTCVHHAATDSHIEYWQCSMCGRYFSDAGCTTQITEEDTKIYHNITTVGSMSGFISSDAGRAVAGSTVTLTLSHLVDAATLQVNSGAVATTDIGNRQYTFTMPAADVTVTASLLPTYALTLPEHTQLLSASLAADGSGKYIAGTVITFKFVDAYAAIVSDVKNGETGLTPDENGVYTVTIGDADIVVTAVFGVVLADGTAYTQTKDLTVTSATYTKTLGLERVDKHQAWLVPFDYTITAADMQKFTFYKINMIANSPSPSVEASGEMWVFLTRLDEGAVLHANMPYVYKPLEPVTDYEFTTAPATLKARNTGVLAKTETLEDVYSFYATYENTTATVTNPFYYVGIDGGISLGNDGVVTVGPYRWIIRKTSKFGGTPSYAREMYFYDGEETTGIAPLLSPEGDESGVSPRGGLEGASWFTIDGRKLNGKPMKRGVYVVGGRKIVIK